MSGNEYGFALAGVGLVLIGITWVALKIKDRKLCDEDPEPYGDYPEVPHE